MRRICIVSLIALASSLSAKAQFFIEFGPRYGAWLNTSGINSIVKDYNDTRTWLTEPMPKVHFGKSYHFAIGTQGSHDRPVGYEFIIQALRTLPEAHGTEPNGGLEEYRKVLFHYGGFGFGLNGNLSSSDHADVLLGFDFMWSYTALRTWYSNNPNFKDSNPDEIDNSFTPGVQLYSRLAVFAGPFGLGIKPYIELSLFKRDVYDLGNLLNGGHTSENTLWWPASIGASATITLCPRHGND